jgi:hypothetical protein
LTVSLGSESIDSSHNTSLSDSSICHCMMIDYFIRVMMIAMII